MPYGYRDRLLRRGLPGFNGEWPESPTGHYLLGHGYRAYNPMVMRFNSPDSESPFRRGGLNAYGYCLGDPVNLTDPDGHAPFFRLLARVGTLLRRARKRPAQRPPSYQGLQGSSSSLDTLGSTGERLDSSEVPLTSAALRARTRPEGAGVSSGSGNNAAPEVPAPLKDAPVGAGKGVLSRTGSSRVTAIASSPDTRKSPSPVRQQLAAETVSAVDRFLTKEYKKIRKRP
ncbi:RHS repeat-associated core domain-containing protein [Pseudomonas japonica]|uniref:RHS repeat-associated core domain-containing protein n=2 Tax=Pseudomonas japonica TaxID=256466 RepID=A0A239B361_9PSED|nr:RHS repeat-associated core domain-containing protein [Pseudomonas japonica]